MTKEERNAVCTKVAWEGGMDNAFILYSGFEEIKDKQFHKLLRQYVDAYIALEKYIGLDTYDGDA